MVKKLLAVAIILLVVGMSIPSTSTTVEKSSPVSFDGKTLYVGGSGEGNYTKIQDAIDNASKWDTVFIYNDSSPYYENVELRKNYLNLIGEDTNTTIIDAGSGRWAVLAHSTTGHTLCNLTLQNVTPTSYAAFCAYHSDNNKIINCRMRNSSMGMELFYSKNTTMRNNRIENNTVNFGITGWWEASEFYNDIDTSNTINGKPMYNIVDESNLVIDSIDIGWLGLINCTNITVKNITITDNLQNILLIDTSDSTISNCKLYNSSQWSVMVGFDSDNNSIENCPILDGVDFITNNFWFAPNCNTISNCNLTFGIAFQRSSFNSVDNCDIKLGLEKSGIAGWIALGNSENNTISNCNIYKTEVESNTDHPMPINNGIEIQHHDTVHCGSNYNNIVNNTFYNFPFSAIKFFHKSTHNKIIGNHIINCNSHPDYAGIYNYGRDKNDNNIIYNNTFINNSRNAFDNSSNFWNITYPIGGNYWDDYSGEDNYRGLNQDIPGSDCIGDTPYNIPPEGGNNSDYYPLMYEWGENPPVADFSFIINNSTAYFNASSSYDRDGTIMSYDWDFGDDTSGTGMIINHTYSENRTYKVTLTVTDDDDKQGSWSQFVRIGINRAPYSPSDPEPPDGATDVDVNADLSWNCSDPDNDPLTFNVYFEADDPTPDVLVSENQTENTYDPGEMNINTTYYWKIVAWDDRGASTSGPIWNFTTETNAPPYPPSDPNPEEGETDVDIDTDLSWTGGDPDENDTVVYDIYLEANDPTPDILVADDINETWFDPGTLDYETKYYWQIIAKDNHDALTWGSVWHFTTELAPEPEPDLSCDGSLSWTDVKPGDTVTGNFTVENVGSNGSLLDWDIVKRPGWGKWTFDPESGEDLTPEDGKVMVNVSVAAPDEKNSEFTGEVKIVNKENSSDFCTIDVSLSTPKNKPFNFNLLSWLFERFPNAFPIMRYILEL
ncbi:MAG: PKD domain-containing protein [Thermoplasmatales archaeon]|nr:MAG: PKD domain-containing protein [Thermoplasmatales archaeon]